jgi:hypothetical protein
MGTFGFAQKQPEDIYHLYQDKICLVSFYQNIASESKIGSFDKIKRYRIGIVVGPTGLIMVSSDVYPVSLGCGFLGKFAPVRLTDGVQGKIKQWQRVSGQVPGKG